MITKAKRIGRPFKPVKKGKRASLGLKVTAEVKRHIDSAARASGRTQSQEAELLIEKALFLDRMIVNLNTSIAEMEEGSVEEALHKCGWESSRVERHGKQWKLWAPPGFFSETEKSTFSPRMINETDIARLIKEDQS